MKVIGIFFSSLLFCFFLFPAAGQDLSVAGNKTAIQIIKAIIDKTGPGELPATVDLIKEGDPDTPVSGIVTSMFPTMEVLKKAVDLNCNLVIVHEPLYYNHLDETKQFLNDPVFLEKKRFINENNLVIWRFHDYIHRMKPDGIETGMMIKLGWQKYAVNDMTDYFIVPETNLKGLLQHLKMIFPENAFYVVGDPEMRLSGISLAVGSPGSNAHYRLLRNNDIDVVISGEVPQWETYEYVRDAVYQGRKKAIIFLGHVNSEEAGMEYCAEWLRSFAGNIPVHFVESGSSYWSY